MPVLREEIPADRIARNSLSARLVGLSRQKNGVWYAHVAIDVEAELGDGRRVEVDKVPVSVRMDRQIGRKPARATA